MIQLIFVIYLFICFSSLGVWIPLIHLFENPSGSPLKIYFVLHLIAILI